jgi:hypothetical protein
MEQTARQPDQQRESQIRSDAAFKPVALPALAAAVKAVKDKPREKVQHELPPILRKEVSIG